MKPIVWLLRALFGLSVVVALLGGFVGPQWPRIGFIGAIVLLVALLALRWVDLARQRKSPAFL